MSIKKSFFIIFSLTLLSLGLFLAILFNSNPLQADILTKIAFFVSLLVFTTGITTFTGFYLRVYFSNKEIIYANLSASIRQAIFISLIIVGLLVLKALRVLTIIDAIALVSIVVILELFFRARN